jgi:cation diffusion facilitator CzcD-associated flavoprotein CzcO
VSKVAIVGSGLAALTAYATLAEAGIEVEVFGERRDPAEVWRGRAAAIRQTHMRSESDGHVRPRTFPGLAAREAWRRRDPRPLVRSVLDRYTPSVSEFLADVERVRESTGWDAALREERIEEIRPVAGGFAVAGRAFRHVLVATGHPGLAVPEELAGDPRVVHAYEPHEYASRVAVVGAGMAAATEWRNALAAGAEVVSVRRREPLRRALNLPRPLFTRRGLARYHAAPVAERAAFLRSLSTPSYPPGPEWDAPASNPRFRVAHSVPYLDPVQVRNTGSKEQIPAQRTFGVDSLPGLDPGTDSELQIVCATGFRRGFRHDPLLRRLAGENALARANGWLLLNDDATVPALTDDTRTLALSGIHAQWAYPASDTLMGMRYVAHNFLRRCRTR